MDIYKKPYPLATLYSIKNRINTRSDYQRPPVWTTAQKQLLIDTILRGYDIPKVYWDKVSNKPEQYDVIDGQQRLLAVWGFQEGKFAMPKDSEPINGVPVAGLKYKDLPDDLHIQFDSYPLDVIVVLGADEEDVRDMFLRLQNGTTLKAQEKRNAMRGKMRDFVKQLVEHPFFDVVGFRNTRYSYDHVAAQITLLELGGGPCNVKDHDLNSMYKNLTDFDASSSCAKKIKRVLDFLFKVFPEKTPELERYNVISLYTLVSHLLERYVIMGREKDLSTWFLEFEQYKRDQFNLSEDESDPEMISYHDRISHSTDSKDSIESRHNFLLRKFFESFPDIELKDEQREFAYEQRLAIFRRDKGLCQLKIKCEGKKCEWDNWNADHIIPWSKGGKTTVANGQVACPECNSAKGAE